MKTKAPKYQTQILNSALNHLDPRSPHFRGSDEVIAALLNPALRRYLDSWVLPDLVMLRDGNVPRWRRDDLSRDRASRYCPDF